jgi:cholesterol transport system auxiliary component
MRKTAIYVLALALISGCGSTHVKRYFQIQSVAPAEPALPKIERRLLVEPPAVEPLYDDIRILYRVSPFEVKYYPYEFWAERPGKQVGAAMAEYLGKKKVFLSIGQGPTKEDPEIILRSRVHALEEIDNPDAWQARLAMDLEFVDLKSGKALLTRSFDRKEKMAGKQVGEFPPVCSRILEEELGKAVWELARALEKKSG